ncbi:hypothetical protein N7478_011798 [Penicillium angulare]|uniref:uncharacterized protein n=1 Tax=Penicillium angulare TaxID=116970 RepID=UPI0025412088|nr:uncharacterized protein N7478_011798 [Penicillium angulare]KAJ5261203.1 hypothetical protein N7478_011798 [Penicillium angulare]
MHVEEVKVGVMVADLLVLGALGGDLGANVYIALLEDKVLELEATRSATFAHGSEEQRGVDPQLEAAAGRRGRTPSATAGEARHATNKTDQLIVIIAKKCRKAT